MTQPDNDLRVIISADTASLSRGMSGAERAVSQAERSMGASLSRIDRAFEQVNRTTAGITASIGRFAAVLGVGGLVSSLADTVAEARAFQVALAQVSTLMKDTAGLDRYVGQVKALARQFGGLPTDQARALYEILSAGSASAANAMDVLTQSNKLAIGGVTEVKTAADGLTSVMNSYGAAAGTAANISDAFFAAAAAGKTNIQELATYIGQVAPIAAQTGVSLDELMAAAAALTAGGIKTSTAMDGLRSVIAAVLKPSQEATEAADAIGLQFNAAALQSKGLAGFLADVQAKTGGSAQAMALLFGGVEALLPVMALGGSASSAFADAQAELQGKAGATEAAYAKMAGTAQQAADRVAAAAAVYRIDLGDRLLRVVQPAMQGLADNFDAVAAAAEQTTAMLAAALVARGLGPLTASSLGAAAAQIQLAMAVSAGAESYTTGARGAAARAAASLEAAQAAAAETNATYLAAAANLEYSTAALAATRADIAHLQAEKAGVASSFAKLLIQREIMALRQIETVQVATLAEMEAALTAATTANTAAMAGAAQATAGHGAALAATTLSARAAAAAMGLLRGALALVGGPMGAILLAAGAAAYYFATRTTEAEAATAAFEAAQRAAQSVTRESATDVEELARQYGQLSDSMKNVTKIKLDDALAKQQEALAALKKQAASAVYAPSSPFTVVEGNHGSDNLSEVYGYERMGLAADQVERLRTAVQEFRMAAQNDPRAIGALAETLADIGVSAGAAGEPLRNLARELLDPGEKAAAAGKEIQGLSARLTLLNDPANDAARAILGVGRSAAQATGGLGGMGSAVATITSALADMNRQIQQVKALEGAERTALAALQQLNDERKKEDPSGKEIPPLTTVSPEYLQLLEKARELETARVKAQVDAGAKVLDLGKRIAQAQSAGNARLAARLEKQKAVIEMEARGVDSTVAASKASQDYDLALAGIDASAGQAAKQIDVAATAQERLAAAAGKGEAAMRQAAYANKLAEEAIKGNGNVAAVAAANRREEAAAILQVRNEFAGTIDAEVAANERLAEAYGVSATAVEDATRYNEAYAQTLKEVVPGENGWTEALDRNIAKLKERDLSRLTRDIAAYQQQMQQASEGLWVERAVAGMSDLAGTERRARYDALKSLNLTIEGYNNLDPAIRKAVDTQLDGAAALARQQQEVQNYKSAWDTVNGSLEKAFDRLGDSLVDVFVSGKDAAVSFGSIFKSITSSLLTDLAKLAVVDLRRLVGLGGNTQGSLLDLFNGGGTSASNKSISINGQTSTATNGNVVNVGFPGTGSSGFNLSRLNGTWLDRQLDGGLTSLSNWWSSPITGNAATMYGGDFASALAAQNASPLGGMTWGEGVGGAIGIASGAYQLSQGNYVSGGGQIVGSALTMAGMPEIGIPIQIISSLFGGFGGDKQYPMAWYDAGGGQTRGAYSLDGGDASQLKSAGDKVQESLRQLASSLSIPVSSLPGGGFTSNPDGHPGTAAPQGYSWFSYAEGQGGWDAAKSAGSMEEAVTAYMLATLRGADRSSVDPLVNKALDSGITDTDRLSSALSLAQQVASATAGLDGLDKSLAGVAASAKKSAASQYDHLYDQAALADEGNFGDEFRALLTRQWRASVAPATEAASEMGQEIAQIEGSAQAAAEAFKKLNLSISDAEIEAAKVAQTNALRDSYSHTLDQQANAAQGKDYLNSAVTVAVQVKAARGNIDSLWAGDAATRETQWAKVVAINEAGAQKVIDDAGLVGSAYQELVGSFVTALKDAGVAAGDIASLTAGLHESSAALEARTQASEDLQKRLLTAQVGAGQAAQAQLDAYATEVSRRRELAAATGDATKAMLGQIYAAEDAASAVSKAAAAEKTRSDLSLRLMEAQVAGGTATQAAYDAAKREADRKTELAAVTDDATKALLRQVYAAQDLVTASEAAKTALAAEQQARADSASLLERAYKAVGRDYRAAMAALDQQQQAELRTALAGGTTDIALLLKTQALERAQNEVSSVSSLIDKQIQARQAEVAAIRETVENAKALQKSLIDTADAMARDGSLSPETPQDLLTETKRQWTEAMTAARGGDLGAMGKLADIGRSWIEATKTYSAGTDRTAFDEVQRVLRELGITGTSTLDAQKAQIDAANSQVQALQKLKQTADAALAAQQAVPVSISDLSTSLSGAIDRLTAANSSLGQIMAGKSVSNDNDPLMKAIFGADKGNAYYGVNAELQYSNARGSMSASRFYGLAYASGFSGTSVGNGEIGSALSSDPDFKRRLDAALDLYWQAQASGLIGKIPGYEDGGIIGNGTWGRDSVIARYAGGGHIALAGGEYVMPADVTAAYRSTLDAMRAGTWTGMPEIPNIYWPAANDSWQVPANDRWRVDAPVTPLFAPPRPAGQGDGPGFERLAAAIEALTDEVKALKADQKAQGGDAQRQRGAIGADTVATLETVVDRLETLSHRRAER